jgi:GNAT superfamily N-acetyltransferase
MPAAAEKDRIMPTPIIIDELPLPVSMDGPEGNEFRAAHELYNMVRVEGLGPAADLDTPAEMLAHMQDQQYERKHWHVARHNGQMVAFAITTWSIDPATRVTWLDVAVHPAWRGQGIGTAMFDRMEALSREAGRPVVQGGAFHLPAEGPQLESPTGFGAIPREERNARFLLNRGYTLEQVYRYSVLHLPVDPATLERHRGAAEAKAGADYRVQTWIGSTPERWQDDVAVIFTRMATDAPAGNLEIDEEPWDAERVRKRDAHRIAVGRTALVAAVEHIPSGHLVAYNGLSVPNDRTRPVNQGVTLVLKEHRGHRLGMLTKIANIQQLQAFSPASPFILTDNAEENRPMLDVNEAVGFVPIAYEGAWKKHLA